jgi:NADH-quinone oxidoreductase subunit L
MTEQSWLLLWIVLLPLAGAIFNGLVGRRLSARWTGFVGCASVLGSFLLGLVAGRFVLTSGGEQLAIQTVYSWISAAGLDVEVGFRLDALSLVMVLVVSGVGFLIHLYSIGYMHGDEGYGRYFAYLNLFVFSMLTLVLADSLAVIFVGWEGVGLCSYLLIGFWFEDPQKAAAGKKAFIVNRIGDLGFLLGMYLLYSLAGTLHIESLRQAASAGAIGPAAATAACLLLFVGASGKSAQIPLYVWLPDAMAGPTPVSALIHAATMVTAGVYLIARLNFLFALSPDASAVVVLVGSFTAFYAATIGLAQNDIKKVLAYSTISQLGYMFVGVGSGNYGCGIFHLMTHAFFKACLFLGAGAVIHALEGEQDIRRMGDLKRRLPRTYATFLLATLAIAGFPPLAGFFSKDEILWKVLASDSRAPWAAGWVHPLAYALTLAGAALTSFYMFRLLFLVFHGQSRLPADKHLHHETAIMTWPLIVLAALSVVGGWVGASLFGVQAFEDFLRPVLGESTERAALLRHFAHSHTAEWLAAGAGVLAALAGWSLAWRFYLGRPGLPELVARISGGLYRLILNKYYLDELYDFLVVRPLGALARFLWKVVDVFCIDDLGVNGPARVLGMLGRAGRLLQCGDGQVYAFWLVLGGGIVIFYLVFVAGLF